MSYNPTQWSAGDTVTSAKLNKIEQGIRNNGFLEINVIIDEETLQPCLDKTWQEIYDANISIINMPSSGAGGKIEYIPIHSIVTSIGRDEEDYFVSAAIGHSSVMFYAATPNDYPTTLADSDSNTQPMS